jgi:hypothetical protein
MIEVSRVVNIVDVVNMVELMLVIRVRIRVKRMM